MDEAWRIADILMAAINTAQGNKDGDFFSSGWISRRGGDLQRLSAWSFCEHRWCNLSN
jgi:hypothetical protein